MFDIPAMTWTLTAVLLAGSSYHLWQAFRSPHLTGRVNNTLHALMNTLMAAMLWNLAPSTLLAQIGLLAGAALWFIIQTVARPEFKILCAGTQGRLKCAYHALTMTGAALMIAMMTHPTSNATSTSNGTPTSMPAGHHHAMTTTPTPGTPTAATALDHTPGILLTLLFSIAALTFLILLIRNRTTTTHHHTGSRRYPTRTEHALEAIGATTMALMFATTA